MTRLLIISLALVLMLSGCGRDNHNHPKDITNKELFEDHCSGCHALAGTGSILLGVPSNTETRLLNLQIRKKMTEGHGADSKMPIFHDMPDKEANRIIAYLRSLPHQ